MPERRRSDAEFVNWASLDVYGSPEGVSIALNAIRSPDPQRRLLGDEYLSLVQQGSRCPASAVAAPFLVGVVADPDVPPPVRGLPGAVAGRDR